MSGRRGDRAQRACARCGEGFADPMQVRGTGQKICEECAERDEEER